MKTGVFAGSVVISASHVSSIQGMGSTEKLPWYRLLMMYSSPFRWALEGLTASVYGYEKEDLECPDHLDYCPYRRVQDTMRIGSKYQHFVYIQIRIPPNTLIILFFFQDSKMQIIN